MEQLFSEPPQAVPPPVAAPVPSIDPFTVPQQADGPESAEETSAA